MLFRQSDNRNSDDELRKLPSRSARIASIAAISRERQFEGSFSVADKNYDFSYSPATVSLMGRRLQLLGRLTVKDSRGQTHSRDRVRATLVGTQGGIGTAPTRPGNPTSSATASSDLPDVESTGATSFCGVMYMHFEPLVGSSLGVPADMSRVQLNARFAPIDDTERTLHVIYSSIVTALLGKQPNASAAGLAIAELNVILGRS
jgi:hypothetical protein